MEKLPRRTIQSLIPFKFFPVPVIVGNVTAGFIEASIGFTGAFAVGLASLALAFVFTYPMFTPWTFGDINDIFDQEEEAMDTSRSMVSPEQKSFSDSSKSLRPMTELMPSSKALLDLEKSQGTIVDEVVDT